MPGIFVNYRSGDEVFAVQLLDERLTAVFGEDRVFVDHRSLRPGEDFRRPLWDRLTASTVLLVLIGKRWSTMTGRDGRRLLDRDEDYVRTEIARALRANKVTIPVLLDGAALPAPEDLPADIADLSTRQYLKIDRKHHRYGVEQVVDAVREHVPAVDGGHGQAVTGSSGPNVGTIEDSQVTFGPYSPAIGRIYQGHDGRGGTRG